ncbi:MAG: ABC transporter ATP-binding protein [Rikenellaceae bacterium]|nr:ABC transporter ATP-binding protein [Rikenellaceae bacterium]
MKLGVLNIIPRSFRRGGVWVCVTIFIRALLNFMGLAALLPVLYLILDSQSIESNSLLAGVYNYFGFTSDVSFVASVAGAVVGFIAIKCGINLLLYRYERDYIYSLYRYLSRNLYIDYFNRGLSFIKASNSAVLSRNVNVVCYTFVSGVLRPMAVLLSEAMLFILLFASIALYSPLAALLTVAIFIPAVWLYFALIRNRVNRYGDIENDAHRRKFRDTVETYRGYADIEINNAFSSMLRQFDDNTDTMVSVGAKNATISTLPQLFTEIGLAAGMALMVVLCVGLDSGSMKILFGVFAVAALRLMPSVRAIMGAWTSLRYNRYTIDIIASADISSPAQTERVDSEQIDFKDCIEVENLGFKFSDSQTPLFTDLSFTIRKGEKIGINGRSGAGKTTLFNLLLGFYPATEGRIVIDGQVLTAENRRRWQNSIGYVSQSVFLTDSTILANIALGSKAEDIDMERVQRAVAAASLSEFVASLPNGLNTRIGECGALLSGGQRQRIGIARALYKGAQVLFFDEATSALDSQTEQSINQAIVELAKANQALTIVVIAHRESSLEYCDRVITLK